MGSEMCIRDSPYTTSFFSLVSHWQICTLLQNCIYLLTVFSFISYFVLQPYLIFTAVFWFSFVYQPSLIILLYFLARQMSTVNCLSFRTFIHTVTVHFVHSNTLRDAQRLQVSQNCKNAHPVSIFSKVSFRKRKELYIRQ